MWAEVFQCTQLIPDGTSCLDRPRVFRHLLVWVQTQSVRLAGVARMSRVDDHTDDNGDRAADRCFSTVLEGWLHP